MERVTLSDVTLVQLQTLAAKDEEGTISSMTKNYLLKKKYNSQFNF